LVGQRISPALFTVRRLAKPFCRGEAHLRPAAMDLFVVTTIGFKLLYAFVTFG
jgi:hypothetical protein